MISQPPIYQHVRYPDEDRNCDSVCRTQGSSWQDRPDDTAGLEKEEALEKFAALREKIAAFQEVFYVERRRSLLLILQAMDTGGKDGAIKGLCAGVNPAGLQIKAFKVPSQEELEHDFLWRAHAAVPG